MSVLINMEMPKSCSGCPMCGLYSEHKGDVHRCDITFYPVEYEDGLDKRHERCPLVPVPPHGRLIDAVELFKEMERKGWFDNADRDKAEDLVLAAPTIIPAEEERLFDSLKRSLEQAINGECRSEIITAEEGVERT